MTLLGYIVARVPSDTRGPCHRLARRRGALLALVVIAGCGSSAPADAPAVVDSGRADAATSGVNDGGGLDAAQPDAASVPPDGDVGHLAATIIGAAGGSLDVPGGLRVEIPAGALAVDTEITADTGAEAPHGLPGLSFDLGPNGTHFALPVTLRFTYASLPAEVSLAGLRVLTRESPSEPWTGLPSRLDPASTQEGGTVIAQTTHFTDPAVAMFPGGGEIGLKQVANRTIATAVFYTPNTVSNVIPSIGCQGPFTGGGNLTPVSAGTVTMSSSTGAVSLPVDPTYHVYPPINMAGSLFTTADPGIVFSWPGDVVPAFSQSVTPVPGDFTATLPSIIPRNADLVIPWTVVGSNDAWDVEVFIYINPTITINCVFPARDMTGTVPMTFLQILPPGGTGSITLSSHSFGGAVVGNSFVTFNVQFTAIGGTFTVQ